ncbi:MAG: DUF1801 domain-containing protein [Pseudomonadota bacterium]
MSQVRRKAMSADVKSAFQAFPAPARRQLLKVRDLVFATAARLEGVGPLTETLKWGEPDYLTEHSGSCSTIRLGWTTKAPDRGALYFNCQTDLVDTFRSLYPELAFEGNRTLSFSIAEPLPEAALERCIELALTYHARKKLTRKRQTSKKQTRRKSAGKKR